MSLETDILTVQQALRYEPEGAEAFRRLMKDARTLRAEVVHLRWLETFFAERDIASADLRSQADRVEAVSKAFAQKLRALANHL